MTSDSPVLVYSAGACSLAVHIALEEIGKPFSLEQIATDKGDARKPEFREINPKGRVPVLLEGGNTLTEAPAILMYLAMSNPAAGIAPVGNDEIYKALEWFNWLSGTVHSIAVRQIWRTEYFSADPDTHQSIVARGKEHLTEAHQQIESGLENSAWALGERYTVVDPFLLVFYRWGNRMKIPMSQKYPAWTAHTNRLLEREAVQRALNTEQISVWE